VFHVTRRKLPSVFYVTPEASVCVLCHSPEASVYVPCHSPEASVCVLRHSPEASVCVPYHSPEASVCVPCHSPEASVYICVSLFVIAGSLCLGFLCIRVARWEQRVHEAGGVERLQIFHTLTNPHELDRDTQLVHHAHHRAAARCAVKLGQN